MNFIRINIMKYYIIYSRLNFDISNIISKLLDKEDITRTLYKPYWYKIE